MVSKFVKGVSYQVTRRLCYMGVCAEIDAVLVYLRMETRGVELAVFSNANGDEVRFYAPTALEYTKKYTTSLRGHFIPGDVYVVIRQIGLKTDTGGYISLPVGERLTYVSSSPRRRNTWATFTRTDGSKVTLPEDLARNQTR